MDELWSIIANEILGGDTDFSYVRWGDGNLRLFLDKDQADKLLVALRKLRQPEQTWTTDQVRRAFITWLNSPAMARSSTADHAADDMIEELRR